MFLGNKIIYKYSVGDFFIQGKTEKLKVLM